MAVIDPANRDAGARLQALLTEFGLGTLYSNVMAYLQEGMSEDGIMLELQNTKEWRTRFSANEKRAAAGLSVLSPAEYLATERSYRQIMQEAGVPVGFYDSVTDFTDFLSKDIAPAELQDRVKSATDFVRSADPAQLAYMKRWYTEGDLIAFALDENRAAPLVGRAFQAASVAGIAQDAGLGLGQSTAEALADAGVDNAGARQGFAQIGQQKDTLDLLSRIDQQDLLTGDQLARGTFLGDVGVTKQVDKLKSRERARFGGSSGVGTGSLGSNNSV